MRYFKAFNPDMTCRGKQYEENTIYEENGNAICCNGVMHFCETPFDCLDYYPLVCKGGRMPVFAEVEPLAKVLKEGNKCASRKLRIGAKLSLRDFINAQVDIQIEKGSEGTAASGNDSVVLRELGYDDTKKARRYVHAMQDYAVVTMIEENFKTKAK